MKNCQFIVHVSYKLYLLYEGVVQALILDVSMLTVVNSLD